MAATELLAANRFAMLCDFFVSSSSLSDEEDEESQNSPMLDLDTLSKK